MKKSKPDPNMSLVPAVMSPKEMAEFALVSDVTGE
jgi:hypothetical protein